MNHWWLRFGQQIGPSKVRYLVSLIQQAESDNTVKVVVFKSADPDYFASHLEMTWMKEDREEAAKLTGQGSIEFYEQRLLFFVSSP